VLRRSSRAVKMEHHPQVPATHVNAIVSPLPLIEFNNPCAVSSVVHVPPMLQASGPHTYADHLPCLHRPSLLRAQTEAP
jgi:hypothetical protein